MFAAEVGLYVDAFVAVPTDPQAHGSELCFIHELPDKLYVEFNKVPFDVIKGSFERHGVMNGVIIERLHKCKWKRERDRERETGRQKGR